MQAGYEKSRPISRSPLSNCHFDTASLCEKRYIYRDIDNNNNITRGCGIP